MKTCGYCHVGHLHKQHITYMNWHTGLFVSVPNMPAWLCDVCANCEIDADAINRLMPLLGPVTRQDPTQPRHVHQQPVTGEALREDLDSDHDRKRA